MVKHEIIDIPWNHPDFNRLLVHDELPTEDLEKRNAKYFAIVQNTTLMAAAGIELYFDCALFRSLVVHSNHRNKGMGKALLDHCFQLVQEHEKDHLYLFTESAHDYFARHGFKKIDREKVPYNLRISSQYSRICPETAHVMHRPLV